MLYKRENERERERKILVVTLLFISLQLITLNFFLLFNYFHDRFNFNVINDSL
jgi:hypothetical protein